MRFCRGQLDRVRLRYRRRCPSICPSVLHKPSTLWR